MIKSTGFGLTITKNLLDLLGGNIKKASRKLGVGTTVEVNFTGRS
jgi:two-component sensor histidine kinase